MKISSYNITDVSYHYVGLRVLAMIPTRMGRRHQVDAISRGVRKLVSERALRLMLPEPGGTYETTGTKVCQELVHLRLARSCRTGYELTEEGNEAFGLLGSRKFVKLRKLMVTVHLQTYDNLRAVLQSHLEVGCVWRPIVEATRRDQGGYIQKLLEPMFGSDAVAEAAIVGNGHEIKTAKGLESILHGRVLLRVFPERKLSVSLFRAMCDRLVSLRLLNVQRSFYRGCEFWKSYSPCVLSCPGRSWYTRLDIELGDGLGTIYLCEPIMSDERHQSALLRELDHVFAKLSPEGGYYDLPDVRDLVCERLMIPEASFDDGINHLLSTSPPVISVGLHYDRISGRRRPLVRNRQLHNLVRRA